MYVALREMERAAEEAETECVINASNSSEQSRCTEQYLAAAEEIEAAKLAAPYDIKLKKLQRDSCERTLRMGHGWARCKSIDSRSGFLVFRHTRFGSRPMQVLGLHRWKCP